MAESNSKAVSPKPADTSAEAKSLADHHPRLLLAMEASYEIATAADKLLPECSTKAEKLWKRSLLLRTKDLAQLVMASLGEEGVTERELFRQLHGMWPTPAQEAR